METFDTGVGPVVLSQLIRPLETRLIVQVPAPNGAMALLLPATVAVKTMVLARAGLEKFAVTVTKGVTFFTTVVTVVLPGYAE